MSGRSGRNNPRNPGRGRGYTTGGRYYTGGGRGKPRIKPESNRKTVHDYVYYIGSAKQASDFVIVTKYLLNHIRKTYTFGDDVADALEKEKIWTLTC